MARTSRTTRRQHTTATKSARRGKRSSRPASRGGPSASRTKEPGVQEFFDRFARALTSGDAETAAACFEYPCVMVMSDPAKYGPNHLLQDPAAAERFFAAAPDMYHERGIEETFPDIEEVQGLGSGLLLVRARFPYIDADGNDMGDGETSLYVLRRQPEGSGGLGYAIVSVITLGADSDRGGEGGMGGGGEEESPRRRGSLLPGPWADAA